MKAKYAHKLFGIGVFLHQLKMVAVPMLPRKFAASSNVKVIVSQSEPLLKMLRLHQGHDSGRSERGVFARKGCCQPQPLFALCATSQRHSWLHTKCSTPLAHQMLHTVVAPKCGNMSTLRDADLLTVENEEPTFIWGEISLFSTKMNWKGKEKRVV